MFPPKIENPTFASLIDGRTVNRMTVLSEHLLDDKEEQDEDTVKKMRQKSVTMWKYKQWTLNWLLSACVIISKTNLLNSLKIRVPFFISQCMFTVDGYLGSIFDLPHTFSEFFESKNNKFSFQKLWMYNHFNYEKIVFHIQIDFSSDFFVSAENQ